jgi:hypothetical protein
MLRKNRRVAKARSVILDELAGTSVASNFSELAALSAVILEGGIRMIESELAVIANDRNTLEQYLATYRRSELLLPEKALLMAILRDAIDCYRKHISARDHGRKPMSHEAEQWIMNDEDDWVFSFSNVCDLLGLDPYYIRRCILDEKRRQVTGAWRHKHRRQAA